VALTIIRRDRPPWQRKPRRIGDARDFDDYLALKYGGGQIPSHERAMRRAMRPIGGGSTAAAYVARNLVFAAPAAVHTVLNVIAPAGHGLALTEVAVSFDGVTATAVPITVELCQSTQGAAGTPAASPPTPVQVRGRSTGGSAPTSGHNYTGEPTTLTVIRQWFITPVGGLMVYPLPLGREIECDSSGGTVKALALRITPGAIVNCLAYMEVEAVG
jgi:hypothetical protein